MHGHQNLRGEQGRARACSAGPKSEETGNQGESQLRNQVMGKTKCVREGGQRPAKAVSDEVVRASSVGPATRPPWRASAGELGHRHGRKPV